MLVKRSIGVAIVLFWCLMNILLLKRQLWAPPPPITLRGVENITERIQESWGVFYRGEKIGHANQTITPKSNGYQIQDRSLLRLQLSGTTQNATTHLDMDVDQEWTLEKFNFVLQANDVKFHARGRVEPGKLILTVESGGHVQRAKSSSRRRPTFSLPSHPMLPPSNWNREQNTIFPPSIRPRFPSKRRRL